MAQVRQLDVGILIVVPNCLLSATKQLIMVLWDALAPRSQYGTSGMNMPEFSIAYDVRKQLN